MEKLRLTSVDEKRVFDSCIDNNVIMTGHFLLTSGRHSEVYINKDLLLTAGIGQSITFKFDMAIASSKDLPEIDGFVGPAVAGIPWASMLAMKRNKPMVFAEKGENKTMFFRKHFEDWLNNKKVAVVEDIVTTGNSAKATIDAIRSADGEVVLCAVIWNRSNHEFDVPFQLSLIERQVESYLPDDCPLCSLGTPLTDPKTMEKAGE